ncbi:hypothetical protein ACW0KB_01965 [Virgibacillus salarius]|nr:hypothetical protein [uncultured Virgibacillus sp.]QRZ19453.1 hypothetical protein JUJ52_07195 [Virgibacillus sp. AGTR]
MISTQGYDLKALEPIGHLLAVPPPLFLEVEFYCQLYVGQIASFVIFSK